MLTADDISEIAECIAEACDTSPVRISAGAGPKGECGCPLAALIRDFGGPDSAYDPDPMTVALRAGLPAGFCFGFAEAFDGFDIGSLGSNMFGEFRREGHALGLHFRKLYP